MGNTRISPSLTSLPQGKATIGGFIGAVAAACVGVGLLIKGIFGGRGETETSFTKRAVTVGGGLVFGLGSIALGSWILFGSTDAEDNDAGKRVSGWHTFNPDIANKTALGLKDLLLDKFKRR